MALTFLFMHLYSSKIPSAQTPAKIAPIYLLIIYEHIYKNPLLKFATKNKSPERKPRVPCNHQIMISLPELITAIR